MKDLFFCIILVLAFSLVYRYAEKELISQEITESLELDSIKGNQYSSCIKFKGSQESFENPQHYDSKSIFQIVKVKDSFNSDYCNRRILVDGKTFLKPIPGEHCLIFPKRHSICSGKICKKVFVNDCYPIGDEKF